MAQAQALAESLKQLPALKVLDLRGNDLGERGVEALARPLKGWGAGLPFLDLSDNNRSSVRATNLLVEQLSDLPELEALGMVGFECTAETLRLLFQRLGGSEGAASGKLTHLDLNDLRFVPGTASEAQLLGLGVELAKIAPKLEVLRLRGLTRRLPNGFVCGFVGWPKLASPGFFQELALGLRRLVHLKEFDLSEVGMSDDEVGLILVGLQKSHDLREPRLSGGSLRTSSPSIDALVHFPVLQELALNDQHFDDFDLEALGWHLHLTPQLRRLELRNNAITGAKLRGFARGLQHLRRLKHLDLSENHYDSERDESDESDSKKASDAGGRKSRVGDE